jgi:glycosyltransferase involved in cell wall biosynthesis
MATLPILQESPPPGSKQAAVTAMRIAIIIEHVNRQGGQERVAAELVERLGAGHEVHLFCFSARGIDESRVRVHRLRCPFRSGTAQSLWILAASALACDPRRFDVVLSQGGNALRQDAVLVHTCHALRTRLVREVQWRYSPPNALGALVHNLRGRAFTYLEGRAVKRCRGRVLTVSQMLKDYVVAQHGLRPDEIRVAENGVDHSVFHPGLRDQYRKAVRDELWLTDDDFVALFVGGRWFDKGVPFAIEALGMMRARSARLMVVGHGDMSFFLRMNQRNNVPERVIFVPPTPDTHRYYGAADCFVFPSEAEGFPLVIGEATASGLPLVATPVGGTERLIIDGESGFFVKHDAREIAECLDFLAEHPDVCRQMGARAHEASLALSWDRQAAEIEAALQARPDLQVGGACA